MGRKSRQKQLRARTRTPHAQQSNTSPVGAAPKAHSPQLPHPFAAPLVAALAMIVLFTIIAVLMIAKSGFAVELSGWIFANIVLLGAAAYVSQSFRVGALHVDALSCGFLFIHLTTFSLLVLGAVGLLAPTPILGVSVLGAVPLGWLAYQRRERWRSTLLGLVSGLNQGPRTAEAALLTWLFVLLVFAQALRISWHVWILPPYVWDSLTYHLPNVAEWVQNARIVTFDTPVARTFWPANYEVFETWFALFPHHDFLIDAAGVPFYLLAAGSVFSIVYSLGAGHRWASFAALLYAYTPSVAIHATTGNNDLPIAAAYLFMLALTVDWYVRGGDLVRRFALIWMASCLALGTKPYIVMLAPGLALMGAYAVWKRRREPAAAIAAGRQTSAILFAAITGLVLGGFWYVRNYLLFGNPLYPTDLELFGRLIFGTGSGGGQQGGFSTASLMADLQMLWERKIFDLGSFNADVTNITGWGWFVFVCGLPALLYGALSSPLVRWLAAGFLVSFLALFAGVSADAWNMRFTLWVPALFAISFAVVVSEMRTSLVRSLFCGLATACMLLNFIGILGTGFLRPADWQRTAALPVKERSTAALHLFIGRQYGDALQLVPSGETIGYSTHGDGWIYPLYDADYSRELRYLAPPTDEDITESMKTHDIRYLFVPVAKSATREHAMEAARAGRLRSLTPALYVRED